MAQELDLLFDPSSLAMIGASKNEQKGGGYLLRGLITSGFKGKLYPVHPKESEIMGLRSYPSVLNIPGEVDVAIVAVPARTVSQVMTECSQKKVKYVIVHAAGFSEMGAQGKEMEEEFLQIARQGGIRIVGPNCMGLYRPKAGINTIIPEVNLGNETGSVAFSGQSGWVTENFILMGHERGLRFSKVVTIGNQSDLTSQDFIQYFANDAETKVTGCYIEGIKRGEEFLEVAKQVSRRKPVIVWKSGRTEAGARAVASHTGSLAGNSTVVEAAFRQVGIISANNLEELIDLAIGFSCPVLPKGNRFGLLVESGGGAAAGADTYEDFGLEMPIFSPETQEELTNTVQDIIPAFPSRQNPIDLVWLPDDIRAKTFIQCSRIMMKEVDAVVLIDYTQLDESYASELASLRDEMGKPIFVIPGHSTQQKHGISLLTKHGIPTYPIPERALRVLSAMVRYAEYVRSNDE